MKIGYYTFLTIVIFASCRSEENAIEKINKKLKLDSGIAFRKDLPEKYNDSSPFWYSIRKERSAIGLPSIENGSPSFQIRVWEELENERMVLILMYKDSIWNANSFIYKGLSSDGHNVDSFAINNIFLGEPKSRWNEFMNELIEMGILELKDESSIPGYSDATDQLIVGVEIAARNYYKYYHLPDPYDQPAEIKDAKSIVSILRFIKKNFPALPEK